MIDKLILSNSCVKDKIGCVFPPGFPQPSAFRATRREVRDLMGGRQPKNA
jgi:hypothetical protein